jgi:hypothetical protein
VCISQEAEEAAKKKAEAEQAATKKAEKEAAAKKRQKRKRAEEEAVKRQEHEVRPHESAWLALPILRAGTGLTCAI